MWVTKKRLRKVLARAYERGFETGYRTADVNWRSTVAKWVGEPGKACFPSVLFEAEEILREKSAEGK